MARVAAWWARWQGRRPSQEVSNPSSVAVINPSVRKMSSVSVKTQGKSLCEVGLGLRAEGCSEEPPKTPTKFPASVPKAWMMALSQCGVCASLSFL